MITIMMVCILVVVSISVLKFIGIFSLFSTDGTEPEFEYSLSDDTYSTIQQKIQTTKTSENTVTEIDPRSATDSRFYGSPIDIRGNAPPEERGYPVYNKIFEDSLTFEYSTYAYEISLTDNPFILSFIVEPSPPPVSVESDSVHSGNIDYGGIDGEAENKPDDCPDCEYPIGSSYEFFLKITVKNPETDEIIYTCGYAGDYSSDLYQWHLIPDYIEKARVDLEGNNINLDLKFGAGRCEDLNSTMVIYRGYEGSSDAKSGSEIDDEESMVWWY